MTEHIYTQEQLIEFNRCLKSPIYFINNYVQCLHPTKGIVPMKLYGFQNDMIQSMHDNKNVILMLSRQMGKTACMAAFATWLSIFNDDKTTLIVGNKQSAATELMDRIKLIYDYLPAWMKPALLINNRGEVRFDNNSRIVARATGINSGRGLSISFLICDELAFVADNMQELFWSAVYPTVSTGGKVVIASTPNGDTNLFYRLWDDAINNKNTFVPLMYKYTEHPDRDEAWKQETISNVGITKFLQEFELEFISNDELLVNTLTLKDIKTQHALLSINKFKVWQKFKNNQEYYIGVDIAEGIGKDNSSIQVYTFPQLEQVAELYDNTIKAPQLYSAMVWIMQQICKAGGIITWTFENNAAGYAFTTLYENDENFPDVFMISSNDSKYGLNTNGPDKSKAAKFMAQLIEKNRLKVNSNNLLTELKNFVKYKHTYRAKAGYYDDGIAATILIVRMVMDAMENNGEFIKDIYSDGFTNWETNILLANNEIMNQLGNKISDNIKNMNQSINNDSNNIGDIFV